MKKVTSVVVFSMLILNALSSAGQSSRWQQKVNYKMDVDIDAASNRFTGKQKLEYWNNSPDTLSVLYYHLQWNAFQPGSMMDMRSQEIGKRIIRGSADWEGRVRMERFKKLNYMRLF